MWFNITGRELHELHLESGRKAIHPLPFLGSVLAAIDPLRQLIASDQGLFVRDTESSKLRHFATLEEKPGNRSNDGRVHPCGALWVGTMGRSAEKHAGAIYHVAGSRVTRLYGNITIPNAICFSPDGATAYFTDTDVNQLMRVDIDPATALPTGDPVLLSDESTSPGGVDGAVCDARRLIWNARLGAAPWRSINPTARRSPLRRAGDAGELPGFRRRTGERLLVTSAGRAWTTPRGQRPQAGKPSTSGSEVKGRFEPAFRL